MRHAGSFGLVWAGGVGIGWVGTLGWCGLTKSIPGRLVRPGSWWVSLAGVDLRRVYVAGLRPRRMGGVE